MEVKERNRNLVREWQASKHGRRVIQIHSVMRYYSLKVGQNVSREDAVKIARYIRKLKRKRQRLRNNEISKDEYKDYQGRVRDKKQKVLLKYMEEEKCT